MDILQDTQLSADEKHIKAVQLTKEKVPIHELINFDKIPENPVKVSVVVPVYNVEQYLRECLDSIINQTLKEIEIICVNDGSTDNCLEILKEYAQKDDRVKIIDKDNAGYGHTMNIGMDMAQGEYIGIVESDDFVELNMYEELYKVAEENDVDFVKADFFRFKRERNGELKTKYNRVINNKNKYNIVFNPSEDLTLMMGAMNTWSGIYSINLIKNHNIRHNETPGASYQDNGFFFQTFCNANRVYFVNKAYYFNRRDNPNSSVYDTTKTFCMKEEYDFVQSVLQKDKKIWETFKSVYYIRKFENYRFSYYKATNDWKKLFLETFYNEFKTYVDSGEIKIGDFPKQDKEELEFLLKDPEKFYKETYDGPIRISVIIPIYNEEKHISQCLDSILEQTLRNIEIICVDDGSIDDSLDILSKYAKDERFVLLQQDNMGAGVARNYGLSVAKGEFVCFMDADDYYPTPSVLRNLYISAKNNDVLICGGSFSTYKNGRIVTDFDGVYKKYTFTKHEKVNFKEYQFDYGYHRFIYNLQMLRNNNIEFPKYLRYQDPPFFVKAMIAAEEFYSIAQVTYVYRKDSTKLKWTKEKLYDLLLAIKENLELAKKYDFQELAFNTIARLNTDFIDIIVEFASNKGNLDILFLLVEIQKTINIDTIGKRFNDNNFIIKPLYRITFGAIERAKRLEDEKKALDKELKSKNYNINMKFADLPVVQETIRKEFNGCKKEIENLNKSLSRTYAENKQYAEEITLIRSSFSFKIGRFITWLPRKIRGLLHKSKS